MDQVPGAGHAYRDYHIVGKGDGHFRFGGGIWV